MLYCNPEQLLALMPQSPPFRFLDEVISADNEAAVCTYRFRPEEYFYSGHFPNNPITPGAILLEAMAQAGVVVPILYRLAQEVPLDDICRYQAFMTDASAEWLNPVFPGDLVTMRATVQYWRKHKMRSKVETYKFDQLVASAVIGGVALRRN